MINSQSVLSKHGISKTKFRTDLLTLFLKAKQSYSVDNIYKKFSSVNKVTIYRALDHFEQKGLIHQVPDHNGVKKYALCSQDECSRNAHSHKHGHFICFTCNQTFCLNDLQVPEINNLEGFYIKELKLILEGYCKKCYDN